MKVLILLEKILPLAFWIMLIFGFNSPYISVLTILSALLHEIGHILFTITFTPEKTSLPSPDLLGFKIKTRSLSYKEEFRSALGGPALNMLIGISCLILAEIFGLSEYVQILGIINVLTAMTNLMPIEEYDGYRIISSLLNLTVKDYSKVLKILYVISFSFSVVMCFISLYFILQIGEGYWIFAVFLSILIRHMAKRQKYAFFEKKEILRDFRRFSEIL